MSRYEALTDHLNRQSINEVPMTFGEIEKLLQAPLPLSARRHRPWWSNNEAGNTAVRAWRRAGRKTARVDMAGEKVVFVKDECAQARQPEPAVGDEALGVLTLSPVAEAMIAREMRRTDMDRASVIAAVLHEAAVERRKRALMALRESLPKLDVSTEEIVAMIREDRDSH